MTLRQLYQNAWDLAGYSKEAQDTMIARIEKSHGGEFLKRPAPSGMTPEIVVSAAGFVISSLKERHAKNN